MLTLPTSGADGASFTALPAKEGDESAMEDAAAIVAKNFAFSFYSLLSGVGVVNGWGGWVAFYTVDEAVELLSWAI